MIKSEVTRKTQKGIRFQNTRQEPDRVDGETERETLEYTPGKGHAWNADQVAHRTK